jgi:hypothetical protein
MIRSTTTEEDCVRLGLACQITNYPRASFGCSQPGRYWATIRVVTQVLGPRGLNTGPRLKRVRLNRAGFLHRRVLPQTSPFDRFLETRDSTGFYFG